MDEREDQEEDQEYESSEEDTPEPVKNERPHLKTKEFLAHLAHVENNNQNHPRRRQELLTPNFELSGLVRNSALLYCAPKTYLWDPHTFGVRIKCPGGEHKMHKSDWRDQLAFDFACPIFLRRRLMKCQKEGCPNFNKTYLVRDENIGWYSFVHTSKTSFSRPLHDWIITSVVSGQSLSSVCLIASFRGKK